MSIIKKANISVALVSPMQKTPEAREFSFIFEEAHNLALKGIDIHAHRPIVESDSSSFDMCFHGSRRKWEIMAIPFILKHIQLHVFRPLPRYPKEICGEYLYALNVSRSVREYNADLIHSHFAYPEGIVGLLVKRETNKPLVITIHGYDILTEPMAHYGLRLNPHKDKVIRKVLNEADCVIAASAATYSEAKKIVTKQEKVRLIPNGVDTKEFNPNVDGTILRNRLGIENRKIIYSLRNHEPKYGLEFLIRAARIVVRKYPNTIFIIGGDGSLRQYHERLSEDLNLGNNILFTGRIPSADRKYYYAMSDIVVVPSVQEAFGLVVAEAMACAKPVIGSCVGGIPDQIVDGETGFLVEPKNSAEIAEKICYLLENAAKVKQLGIDARKSVEEKFNLDSRINKIMALYNEILKR